MKFQLSKSVCLTLLLALICGVNVHAQNLSLSISPGTSQVVAGTAITYTFTVTNSAPVAALNVTLTVPIPANVFHLADDSSCDTSTAGFVVCPMDPLGNGDSDQAKITFRVDDDFVVTTNGAGFLTLDATVSAATGAPDLETSQVSVTEVADLRVFQVTTTAAPRAGEIFNYAIHVVNYGPSSARNVSILTNLFHTLDERISIQSCALSVAESGGAISQFTCTTGQSLGNQFGNLIGQFASNFMRPFQNTDGDFDDNNTPDGTMIFPGRMRASFRMTALEDITVIGRVTVDSPTTDPDISNNEGNSVFLVSAAADLSVAKSATGELEVNGVSALPFNALNPEPFPAAPDFTTSSVAVTAGRRIRYAITVTTEGPSEAENVVVTDRLPFGVSVVPGSLVISRVINTVAGVGTDGSCQFGTPGDPNDKMTCHLGSLQFDDPSTTTDVETETVTIQFDVVVNVDLSPNTILANNVTVSSDDADLNNSNNAATAFSVVSPLIGVSDCSVGGQYSNIACGTGSATIGLNGFGFALPEDGAPVDLSWTSTCPGGVISDPTISNPTLTFTTANPDQTPVSCSVELAVQNSFASSTCTGVVTVVDCSVDCQGTLGGSAELDRCGACEGDGQSCLGCSNVDVSSNLVDLTTKSLKLRGITFRAARHFRDAGGSAENARKARLNARKLHSATLSQLSDIPSTFQSCTNANFCTQSSLVGTLEAVKGNLADAAALANKTIAKLKNATGDPRAGRQLKRKANGLITSSGASVAGVPLNVSSCS